MSLSGAKLPKQGIVDPDATPRPVFVLSDRHERVQVPWHSHRRSQLIHVSAGALTVMTRRARFVIPPQRAVWIEPGVEHRIASQAPFWLTTCYVEPGLVDVPDMVQAVAVDRLTDELLIAASSFGGDYPENGREARLVAVLLDRMPRLKPMDIYLPEPGDARLRRIADRLIAAPDCNATLAALSADAALTERTAARLFVKETGLTFGRWRQHLKLQAALEHLSAGASVTEAAFAVGYSDVSSFIAAFKQLFGKTPSQILSG
ncbi:AraC family transcriptional regulator [Sinirhodobacter populi]|uniref:AraC family transcriptional regulator n=1 Tax=Paenirhodobacter populi TaxID=2306993 RepID=A0A443KH76_9RHOB|nr:helix-turn-helix transcriptional regulator [Sinirhodobacter populi]RWR32086.1 AraC family transcriptional regulator [Sinirhodobacter populi]